MRPCRNATASLCVAVAACAAAPAAAQDALPQPVLQALHAAGVPPDALGAAAVPLGSGLPWRHRAQVPMPPASTIKIATAIVALDRLGAQHRGHTELRSAAPVVAGTLQGDLLLVGGGDPDLGVAQFWALLLEMREQGIVTLAGDLVIDRSRYDPPRGDVGQPPFDEAPEFAYNAIPDALQLAGNLLTIDIDASGGTEVQARTVPALPGVEVRAGAMALDGGSCRDWGLGWRAPAVSRSGAAPQHITIELLGSFPAGCRVRAELQLIDRLELAERLFRALWQQLGGRWDGRAREMDKAAVAAGGTPTRLLARRQSRPWREVLLPLMKTSDNPLARLLFLELGAAQPPAHSPTPTAARAAGAVRQWLDQHGIDATGLVLDNGSGLSRSERISAWQLARMLQVAHAGRWGPELAASLPVAGVEAVLRLKDSPAAGARLKTGTLRDAVGLAGYVRDPQGRTWAYAAMIEHPRAAQARPAIEALADHLARHGLHALPAAAPPGPQGAMP